MMKQCKKDFWVSNPWGKVIFVLAHWIALGIGWKFCRPKIITKSGEVIDLTLNEISLFLFAVLPMILIIGYSLVSKKIQAGVAQQKQKNDAEIEQLKLEICKIKCQRKLVESENKRLELQKENQQLAPEN